LWLHSLKVAQLLRSAACLHTNQSRSYLNHLVQLYNERICLSELFLLISLLTIQQYRDLPNAMLWFSVCYFMLHIQVECPSNISLEAEVFLAFPFPYSVLQVRSHIGGSVRVCCNVCFIIPRLPDYNYYT